MKENKQWKQLPFTIELAKKIQSGEIEGRIVTNHGKVVTLVDATYGFGEEYWIPIIWHWTTADNNQLFLYNSKGECKNSHSDCYLHIELPEETPQTFHTDFPKGHAVLHGNTIICVKDEEEPKHEFKIGDKVYVNLNMDNIDKVPSIEKWLWSLYNGCIGKVVKFDGELLRIRFDNLQDAGFYPNQLEHLPKHELNPFDKVLVRDNNGEKWAPDIFRYYDDNGNYDYPYRCCANDYRQCIPYTGNEHLFGTTNNPKEN